MRYLCRRAKDDRDGRDECAIYTYSVSVFAKIRPQDKIIDKNKPEIRDAGDFLIQNALLVQRKCQVDLIK